MVNSRTVLLVTGPSPHCAPLVEFDLDAARRDIDAHLLLPLQVAKDAAAKVRPGGSLLFTGGTGGRHTAGGPLAHRGASRHDQEPRGRDRTRPVNLIGAGFADTPLSASLLSDQIDQRRAQLSATLPIGRVVGPADIAAPAVHLMTNTAITGATFDIDGGQQLVEG